MATFNSGDYENIRDYTSEIQNNMKEMAEHSNAIDSIFKSLGTSTSQVGKIQKEIKENLKNSASSAEGFKKIQKSIEDVLENNKNLGNQIKSDLFEQLDTAKQYYDVIEKAEEVEERRKDLINEMTTASDNLVDGLQSQVESIPVVGKLLSKTLNFDKVKSEFKDKIVGGFNKGFATAMESGKGMTGALQAGLKGAIGGLKGFAAGAMAALGPILLVVGAVMLIKKALELDQQVADLSREMGVANDEAREMVTNFNEMSLASGNLNMSTKNLIEAQKQLASSIGMTAQYSGEMLQDQIHLTKYMGMSGDEAANFQKLSAQTGMSVRDMQTEVAGTVGGFNELTGASIDFAGVMRDISNLSLEMQSRFQGNVKEMALAVTQAKALGITLQESSDAAQNLLNMESSLKAEMKARVLTGVNINNDEIRRAQLFGTQADVLRAQAKQMKEIGDVSKKLPHEQKAIADAMGMSREQLLKMNQQQMVMNKLNVTSLDNLTKEQLMSAGLSDEKAKQMILDREKQSQQEKMNAAMDKMNAVLAEAGAVILPVVGYLVDIILPTVTKTFKMVGAIFKFLGGFVKLFTDPIEGIKMMGEAIYDFVIAPFEWLGDTIGAIFGAGDESTGYDKGMAESGESIDDGIVKPDGSVVKTNPADFIMAMKDPSEVASKLSSLAGDVFSMSPLGMAADAIGGLFGGGDESTAIDYDKLAEAISNQPLQLVIDGKVISTITRKQSMNKSYNKQMG